MKNILKTCLCCAACCLARGSLLYAADVRTDFDKHADFSRIHNYCWGQVSTANPLYERASRTR